MKMVQTLETVKTEQEINLIDNVFTAAEAATIINDVLNAKINFHKIKRLSIKEGNENDACEYDNGRIQELLNEQQIAKEFFSQARIQGKKLKIKSKVYIGLEE
ncbi:conserved hypothetical protein [Tenacibaculum sp. 190524A05c]|uniref:Uncharacterized protein n=2 Tax=Tenacibaculum platacis TaxID=3137852 RepID=A0ABP1EHP5_9FLAO